MDTRLIRFQSADRGFPDIAKELHLTASFVARVLSATRSLDHYAGVRQLAGRKGEVWGAESGADKVFVLKAE